MNIENLLKEHDKVVPLKKAVPVLSVSFVLITLTMMIVPDLPNKSFYAVSLEGRVDSIYNNNYDRYFLIAGQWYLIKSNWVRYLEQGDSVTKQKDSYVIQIDKSAGYRYYKESKSLVFEKVKRLPAKQKY